MLTVAQCSTSRHSVASGDTIGLLQLWERLRAQRRMRVVFLALVSRHRPQDLRSPRPAACWQDFEDRALGAGR